MKYHIDAKALQDHIAILGKTGSGKTYTAKSEIAERLLSAKERLCVIDPTEIIKGIILPPHVVEKALNNFKIVGKCWESTFCLRNKYHCALSYQDSPHYIHRVVYAAVSGKPIPQGIKICHSCDNGKCMRPSHLFAGTQLDNVKDMHAKGRARKRGLKGIENTKATLTFTQIQRIRKRSTTQQRKLAKEYGVSQSTIWRILNQKTRIEA